jgi:hypothetical protein
MQSPIKRIRGIALALGLSTALLVGALPASAQSTVTQSVTAGSLSASLGNLGLTSVPYSLSDRASIGALDLAAEDLTGSSAGWNVTVLASNFVWTTVAGSTGGTDIPAVNFTLISAAVPVLVLGQAVGVAAATGPNPVFTSAVPLNTARKVIAATAAYGDGSYTQDLGVSLNVPGQSKLGLYTSTLTTTITTAP